jgi:predicted phosphodiesterase
MCEILGLKKFAFVIPRSEMALIELFDKRLIFTHGTRIKGGNGVGGVAVPISRYFNRVARSFNADYMFLGHFHQSIYNKQFCVNGSVVGYSPYAMGNGCDFEVPQQSMVILDSKRGFTAYNAVYLD